MECEVCGRQAEKLFEVDLEGARVMACGKCAELGKRVRERRTGKKSAFFYAAPGRKLDAGQEIVADLGKKVMAARQRAGLKREELARKIFEKESVLHRVESGDFVPSDKVIKKLEKELGLSLREKSE